MKSGLILVTAIVVFGLSLVVNAAESDARVTGSVEVRPSWTTKSGSFATENSGSLGYQFNPNLSIRYVQYFNTNLYDPAATSESGGLNLQADVGFVGARFNNLWVSQDGKTSFSVEPRLYTPTASGPRGNGMITISRNYLKLKYKATDTLTLSAMSLPIVHLYTRAGTITDGKATANPIFEHRLYLLGDLALSSKLTFSFNLLFHQKRLRDFVAEADNNNSWTYFLWTYPELSYALTANTNIGLAYYSGNLVSGDLSKFTIGDGLEDGVTQLVFSASL